MKLNIKGLVFVGFAAAVFASAAQAADKIVTSKTYVDNKYVAGTGVTIDDGATGTAQEGKKVISVNSDAGDLTPYSGDDATIDVNNHTVSAITTPGIGAGNGNLVTGGQVQTALDGKVDANATITGATKTKITYDSKGLVTAGADLVASDIPDLSATYEVLSNKVKTTNDGTTQANSISDTSTDNEYPSAKVVYNYVSNQAVANQADWTETDANDPSYIQHKPTLATVATTGEYSDLLNQPTIGSGTLTVNQNSVSAGTFNANATSAATINIVAPDWNAASGTAGYIANKPTFDVPAVPNGMTCDASTPCALVLAGSTPSWEYIQQ